MEQEQEKPKSTLVDTIYSNIRADIARQIMHPGEKLNVKKLAERYGTSQTPVKLALNRLISENVVVNYPQQGMKIKTVSPEEITETFDVRLMLDLYMTKEIITTINYNENIRQQICKNVEEHLELITDDNYASSIDNYLKNYSMDREFHELYLKSTGNKMMVDIFNFINPYNYVNFVFRKQSRDKNIAGVMEHKYIIDAILAEDEEALIKAVTLHYNNAKRAIELIIKVNKIM